MKFNLTDGKIQFQYIGYVRWSVVHFEFLQFMFDKCFDTALNDDDQA